MKRLLIIVCVLACTFFAKAKDRTQYVNPLMGSQSTFELSTGNTYPAIARPWGMNFWTPQTGKMGDGWQYTYTANKIRGFKQKTAYEMTSSLVGSEMCIRDRIYRFAGTYLIESHRIEYIPGRHLSAVFIT